MEKKFSFWNYFFAPSPRFSTIPSQFFLNCTSKSAYDHGATTSRYPAPNGRRRNHPEGHHSKTPGVVVYRVAAAYENYCVFISDWPCSRALHQIPHQTDLHRILPAVLPGRKWRFVRRHASGFKFWFRRSRRRLRVI